MPVRHVPGRDRWPNQRAHRLRPAHVARDRDLDIVRELRVGVTGTRRRTRERLQCIVIRPVELPPDAQVDPVVEIDRAPLVTSCTDIAIGAAAVGDQREPLPVHVTGAAGDRFLDRSPAQGAGHGHAGLEVGVGVVLARSTRSSRCTQRHPAGQAPATVSHAGPGAWRRRPGQCRRGRRRRCRAPTGAARRDTSATRRGPRRCRRSCPGGRSSVNILGRAPGCMLAGGMS